MNPEPESMNWLRIVIAFLAVFGLLGVFGFALKYFAARGFRMPGLQPRAGRLQVVESLPLDVRRRLMIVRCDGKEHLLLLGVNQDIVIDTSLTPNQNIPIETPANARNG